MYGIIIDVSVDITREEEARDMFTNMVVPRARSHKGIVAGYGLRDMDSDLLRVIELYDTEANTRETAERIKSEGPPPGGPVKLVSISIYEVLAQL